MSDKLVKTAIFKASYPDHKLMHDFNKPEFAFIGRSNVGKSSLINMLTGRKELALTSSKPGKTRQIVCFEVNEKWMLIDLPGYGYAKISKTDREKFGKMVNQYLIQRTQLYCLFVLIDSRIEPQKIDLEFVNWCGSNQIPFVLAFTKADKVKEKIVDENIHKFLEKMSESWDELPQHFITSAENKTGREDVLDFIVKTINV
jgi:GTP-binding protein